MLLLNVRYVRLYQKDKLTVCLYYKNLPNNLVHFITVWLNICYMGTLESEIFLYDFGLIEFYTVTSFVNEH